MNLHILLNLAVVFVGAKKQFLPHWDDLDQRPLPRWYDRAKIGILVHWGVYSVPAYGPSTATDAEWILKYWKTGNQQIQYYMDTHYSTGVKYTDLAENFTAAKFKPSEWADLFKKAGARYVILTAKHHDGFLMFPSKTSKRWNAKRMGPHRDLVGELNSAIRNESLEFGVYYSLYEWYNKIYLRDKKNQFRTNDYVKRKVSIELLDLVDTYKPSVIWADGDWYNTPEYWNSTGFLAWLYNESPVRRHVVVNDRWGKGTWGQHGDFYNVRSRYNPRVIQSHKWENVFGLDKRSWGYRQNMGRDLMTIEEVLDNIVSTVSCGGNALINIGATGDGRIPEEFKNVLKALGKWLEVNGEAIYDSSPWMHQNEFDSKVWFTCKTNKYDGMNPINPPWQPDVTATYAIFFKWPDSGILKLTNIVTLLQSQEHDIQILDREGFLPWLIMQDVVHIKLPDKLEVSSKYAWTLKLTKRKIDVDENNVEIIKRKTMDVFREI